MKHSDEAIDKVLAGLRTVEAPLGMNRRILEGAQARAVASSSSPWFGITRLMGASPLSLAGWVVVCSMVMVTAIAIPTIRRLPQTTQPKHSAPLASRSEVSVRSRQAPLPEAHLQVATHPKARQARVIRHREAADLRYLQASYPAPPMPLTEEERLLLGIMHEGDPVEMAMLDPDVRARQFAESKAEFEQFFELSARGKKK